MKKMRKTLSLILSLVLAFSLAAVPAFAADTTEAETSTGQPISRTNSGSISACGRKSSGMGGRVAL